MTDEEQKAIFSKNLNRFIYQSGKQQKEVAYDLGYSPTTFNTWCVGKIIPSAGKIQKIADYFGVGKSDLLDEPKSISRINPRILEYYEQLNDIGKHEAIERVKELTYIPKYSALGVMAAHNDNIDDEGELDRINNDMTKLKRPN